MKRIAIVTSGGDAPGINAAVRAAVRTAIDKGWETFGVRHGYAGLANDDFFPLGLRDVGGIIQRGGTMLGSKRYPEFKTDETQRKAIRFLRQREIDALIVIGGDGSQAGAFAPYCFCQLVRFFGVGYPFSGGLLWGRTLGALNRAYEEAASQGNSNI